ncbi:MAG TPA: PQQ-binding-like beta-propeller repeat protein [Vicinamibacterales bacterium]|jgi:outer membrane protein assembly factor BamB
MRSTRTIWLAAFWLGALVTANAQNSSLDYTQWRGPNRDGSAASFAQPQAWPDTLTMRWKVDVGEGYATPIVVGNRVYTHTRQGGNEVMSALDSSSGKVIWQTSYPAPYKMNPATKNHGQGPKSTPLFFNGKLYTLGISGIVSAFDAASGKLLWQKPAPPVDPMYGTAMSPIAEGGLVIFHVGGQNQGALTAFDANTGDVKWSWNGDGPAYASPIAVDLGGTRQIIAVTQENVIGISPLNGELLWKRPYVSKFTANSITPILYGDTIIVSEQEKGIEAFRVIRKNNQWSTESVWESRDVSMALSNGVLIGDTLFGLSVRNRGQYFALDAKSGKALWLGEGREADNTAIAKSGNLLFLLNEDGELVVARSSPTGIEPVKRYTVAESATWAQPTISGNRIFVKDVSTVALWTLN